MAKEKGNILWTNAMDGQMETEHMQTEAILIMYWYQPTEWDHDT